MSCLYQSIVSFRNGNSDDFLEILEVFNPLLKSLHRKSFGYDTYSDLVLFLIELLKKLKISNDSFREDKYIISYIAKALKNHYIYLNKKKCKLYDVEVSIDPTNLQYGYSDCDNIIFYDLLNNLTDKEKNVIIYKYIYSYSDTEIGKQRHVSRQYIHKVHKRALEKVKEVI